MPQVFFDNYALEYDGHFSDSIVGKAQREIVHKYLKGLVNRHSRILEVNCGTGEDALFLAKHCKEITCTDISGEMIEITSLKVNAFTNCTCIRSSIQELQNNIKQNFNFIFSNFGGLNCLNHAEMQLFLRTGQTLAGTGSDLVFVIMGRKCVWERFYFLLKRNFKDAFRRNNREGVLTGMKSEAFNVFYYSPADIKRIFGAHYKVIYKRPVGLFIPPSYLNSFFEKHLFLFFVLNKLEKFFSRCSFLSDYADHYLIHLKRR